MPAQDSLPERVLSALRTVYDPEIPVNVYDLGLIYRLDVTDDGDVDVDMTLTAPACPVAELMPVMVEKAIRLVDGVTAVKVQLVWDPPWTMDRMTDEAKLEVGLL
ncbi:MAG: SUF system Fe-S cluster assembly protein [Thiotrichales bacterium]